MYISKNDGWENAISYSINKLKCFLPKLKKIKKKLPIFKLIDSKHCIYVLGALVEKFIISLFMLAIQWICHFQYLFGMRSHSYTRVYNLYAVGALPSISVLFNRTWTWIFLHHLLSANWRSINGLPCGSVTSPVPTIIRFSIFVTNQPTNVRLKIVQTIGIWCECVVICFLCEFLLFYPQLFEVLSITPALFICIIPSIHIPSLSTFTNISTVMETWIVDIYLLCYSNCHNNQRKYTKQNAIAPIRSFGSVLYIYWQHIRLVDSTPFLSVHN